MIKSFADKTTLSIALRRRVRSLSGDLQQAVLIKLEMLDLVANLNELRIPPSNHLEKPVGDRAGQWSVRVNRQWRICFVWRDGDAYDVELADYH